ncbi:MAG: AAA family ATPase [Gammaproteobacteria bacterium]|nr:AAA family ATPase [Gammaproteobacteria bacterium]
MVHLPVLTELRVTNYEMFPGHPAGDGLRWSFRPGVTVIAGINGLGKTTLLTMILRSLTGPYDLTGEGAPSVLGVTLPDRPVRLRPRHLDLFKQRVSDGAARALVELSVRVGEQTISIERNLSNLALRSLAIDGTAVSLPNREEAREAEYQATITSQIGLSSFVDVLLILHYVVLFYESRPGALWDTDAQRHLLRALCLERDAANRVAELERQLQRTDSRARNVHSRMTTTRNRLDRLLQSEANAASVLAELTDERARMEAEMEASELLEEQIEELDEGRRRSRLDHERTKLTHEEAQGAIEKLKYDALLEHFPTMDDTTRLILARVMADGRCIVCNAKAEERQVELEDRVSKGFCPICGSAPETQDNLVSQQAFHQARLDRELGHAARAKRELATHAQRLEEFDEAYRNALSEWATLQETIRQRQERDTRLRSQLPDSEAARRYEAELESLGAEHNALQAERGSRLQALRDLLSTHRDAITTRAEQLQAAFAELIQELLVDEVRLVQVENRPRYLESPGPMSERIEVPAYAAEMSSPALADLSRRSTPSEVSESQRELIDLAFRLALVDVFASGSTFAMETPEASLDGIAMGRVGDALAEFATTNDNRLVVTTNLTNAGVVTAMFQSTEPNTPRADRMERVLNLLEVALPNQALLQDRRGYQDLLENAVGDAVA